MSAHPNSLKNLKPPWKPGQSGNPKGRPKRKSLETLVLDLLDQEVQGTGQTRMEALARILVDEMLNKRNGALMKEFLEREWPKKNLVNVGGQEENPLNLADLVKKAQG